jgi:hypothetical protein
VEQPESWRTIRQDTAAAVEDIPAGELITGRPEAATREVARHILDASDGLAGMLWRATKTLPAPISGSV